jgi:hypothetical protein
MNIDDEVREMFDECFGRPYDETKLEKLTILREELHQAHLSVTRQLSSGKLTNSEFINQINEASKDNLQKIAALIGDHDFEVFFDFPPSEIENFTMVPDDLKDNI